MEIARQHYKLLQILQNDPAISALPDWQSTVVRETQRAVSRTCAALVHGIRHHEKFALSPEVTEVCSRDPLFARARNARLIMSNIVPDMETDDTKPYCIWHPDLASEDTYREVARRYPDMRYNVGRACAAAGYDKLYHELNLLPDVSIAEEARDNAASGGPIFKAITDQSVRYKVMDDYTRSVRLLDPVVGASLNGDTAVRSSLAYRENCQDRPLPNITPYYFDIEEDGNLGETSEGGTVYGEIPSQHADLLYSPLPQDLPAVNKDVLINMAAYEGNIDRYSRLRRPKQIVNELLCVARGIYHHTSFARWLAPRLEEMYGANDYKSFRLQQAVHARFIMNNDLSRIDDSVEPMDLPLLIWYPQIPTKNTLRELAWRRRDMWMQVAVACVYADYQDVYDEVCIEPNRHIWRQALHSQNTYYYEDQTRRAAEKGVDLSQRSKYNMPKPWPEYIYSGISRPDKEPTCNVLTSGIANTPWSVTGDLDLETIMALDGYFGIYGGGLQANAASWQTFISATDRARERPGELYSAEEDFERRSKPKPGPWFYGMPVGETALPKPISAIIEDYTK
ncbi:hypothetical protein CPLU01_01526 [Colletotrichum plurivorum]|uniref:Uncharacterized protein n=1 Tax=Colletotrichum plurivorum TaxID=2175906 RepID=A0A8H6NP22_9PEZI|nr:hypothetical protein CPLU01_01526 [Colletotrichum plurivorum]